MSSDPKNPGRQETANAQAQLEKILSSRPFLGKARDGGEKRAARFLRYVVEKTLAGNLDAIREYPIGVDVLGRPADFNPEVDNIVRVEAGRLRNKLNQYYLKEGSSDEIRIEIPTGQYIAVFRRDTIPVKGPQGIPDKMLAVNEAPAPEQHRWNGQFVLAPDMPSPFELQGFAYSTPTWLTSTMAETFCHLAKAALILLAFDRTNSGCWGKTYLFRRIAANSGMPLAGGSLTGTPFALTAIGSSVETSSYIRDWMTNPLLETLARTLTEGGQYLQGFEARTMGVVPVFEPLRHTAGALLTRLLLHADNAIDLNTAAVLSNAALEPMAWDKAVIARALVHIVAKANTSDALVSQARARVDEVLDKLTILPSGMGALTLWSNPYTYGLDVTNQWATAWALLPFARTYQSADRRQSLIHIFREFLLAQAASTSGAHTLLPNSVNTMGRGEGRYVFGTAVALLSWRTLELSAENLREAEQAGSQGRRAIDRILTNRTDVLELPSINDASNPIGLEGYLAWAGLLLASASIGIRLTSAEASVIIQTTTQMAEASDAGKDPSAAITVLNEADICHDELLPAVSRSISRMCELSIGANAIKP